QATRKELRPRQRRIRLRRVPTRHSPKSFLAVHCSMVNCRVRTQEISVKLMGTIAQAELYRLISAAQARGERVVVATVAHTRGSTPQRRGAKMLFFASGDVAGTVGGGCIEAEVWAGAREALRTGRSARHKFRLTADEASEEGMG